MIGKLLIRLQMIGRKLTKNNVSGSNVKVGGEQVGFPPTFFISLDLGWMVFQRRTR